MRCNEEDDLHSPAMIRAADMTYMDFLSQHYRLVAQKGSYCKSLGKHAQFSNQDYFLVTHEDVCQYDLRSAIYSTEIICLCAAASCP